LSTSSAERMRRTRERRANGRILLQIEIDEDTVATTLVALGFLDRQCMDIPESIAAAIVELLRATAKLPVARHRTR
jgi:hypothetical protein